MSKKLRGILFLIIIVIIGINFKNIIKVFYPLQYQSLVEKYSHKYGLNKYLVYSLIRVESKFDPMALSNKNAAGLMQITGQTGKYIAKLIGDKEFKQEDLMIPETNIKYGCFYFRKLIRDFDGNVNYALAAYNAGEGNVRKWLTIDENGRKHLDTESIPYVETRKYVKKVNKYLEIYTFLYSNKHTNSIPNFFLVDFNN